jgi:prolyl-tRNA synthetase
MVKKSVTTAITPTRAENYASWYQQVIAAADLAENASIHGCMIIKPWGYAIWENIQKYLDQQIKADGHHNMYFPLFVPVSYLEKEAAHVGFAKESAVVTHRRLEKNTDGRLVPVSPLEEPLVVRPTSETIIGESFSRWVQSYRDLPLKINQWANIVRWEMRTRLFLRTTEFLWQEGHTAHATDVEAQEESLKMLNVYAEFMTTKMAIPVILGEKTLYEKFPGAECTYTLEAMMQDKKALQAGTSHFLGQNFAKAFDIKFSNEHGSQEYVWTTSWGVSTRLLGGLIMTHADDNGLVLPPALAPIHIVILPVFHQCKEPGTIIRYCEQLKDQLTDLIDANGQALRVHIDQRDLRPGDKAWQWVKKGVPIRIEIGPKELEYRTVFVSRRHQPYHMKESFKKEIFIERAVSELHHIQTYLYDKASQFLNDYSCQIDTQEAFYKYFKSSAGFAYAFVDVDNAVLLKKIQTDLKVTPRCIPFDKQDEKGSCLFTGKENVSLVVFAKGY